MAKTATIIATVLLATSAGCRTAPQASLAAQSARPNDVQHDPVVAVNRTTGNQLVTYVGAAPIPDRDPGVPPQPEALPPVMPVETDRVALSLADVEAIAFQNNPTLATAAARMRSARGRWVQAGLYPNPVAGYHATEIGNLGTAGQQGGFVSQRFITGGKRRLDQAIAAREFDVAHFRFHAQELRVLSDVRVRFSEALVAQQRLGVAERLAGIGEDLAAATEKLLAGRLSTPNDLLQAEIRAEEARILVDNARNDSVEAWRRLSAVVGMPLFEVTPLAGALDATLPELDWDTCYAMVLEGNPELAASRARVERAGAAIARSRREPIPNVDVWVSVRHHNVTDSDVANVQVGVPLPVFDKNQGNIRSAQAEWVAANGEFRRTELELLDRLAVTYRRYANARQQVDRYRETLLPKAARSLDLVSDGYERGQVEYLMLLTAQQTYWQVNLSYLDALRELRTAFAMMEGQLLDGSLTNRL